LSRAGRIKVFRRTQTVMRGLDPRIHLSSKDDGLPGQARQ
jgi:hypothetical protein